MISKIKIGSQEEHLSVIPPINPRRIGTGGAGLPAFGGAEGDQGLQAYFVIPHLPVPILWGCGIQTVCSLPAP